MLHLTSRLIAILWLEVLIFLARGITGTFFGYAREFTMTKDASLGIVLSEGFQQFVE